jgi:hypothetical protein
LDAEVNDKARHELEFLYNIPSTEFYQLFAQDYLNLKRGTDTASNPVYMMIAPIGSGKTKFIFDLALYKKLRIIYIDWKNYPGILREIVSHYKETQRVHQLPENISDNMRLAFMQRFSKCLNDSLVYVLKIFKWICYIANQMAKSQSPENFLKLCVQRFASIEAKILQFIASKTEIPKVSFSGFIFAFDECHLLLKYLNLGEVYTFEERNEGYIEYKGSLYTIFSRACEEISS